MATEAKKKKMKLRLELRNSKPEEMTMRVLKDWERNATRLQAKVLGCLGEGASFEASVEGKPILLEASSLKEAFERSLGGMVIIIRV